MSAIRCDLVGSDTAKTDDMIAGGAAPVLNLCRLLVAGGADPDLPLECYRNGVLALRVKSIGVGAILTVRETETESPRFVRWKPWPVRAVRPPVNQNADGQDPTQVLP